MDRCKCATFFLLSNFIFNLCTDEMSKQSVATANTAPSEL